MKFSTILLTLMASVGLLVFAGCSTQQPMGEEGDTGATANLEVVNDEAGVNAKAQLDVTDGSSEDEARTVLEVTDGSTEGTAALEVVEGEGDAPARNPEAGDTDTAE